MKYGTSDTPNSFITSDGYNLLTGYVNPVANLTVSSKNRPMSTNWSEINPLTYQGQMPTDYGTIMGSSVNAPLLSFGGRNSSISNDLVAAGFSLDGSHIDNSFIIKHQTEMAKKAEEAKKESEKGNEGGTGSYTYEVNDKGEITYKKPDGKKCTVTEFQKEAGMAAYRKAAEESKAKKEKS